MERKPQTRKTHSVYQTDPSTGTCGTPPETASKMTYFKFIVTQWLAYLSKKKKKDFLLILKALQILRILIFGKPLCPYIGSLH